MATGKVVAAKPEKESVISDRPFLLEANYGCSKSDGVLSSVFLTAHDEDVVNQGEDTNGLRGTIHPNANALFPVLFDILCEGCLQRG